MKSVVMVACILGMIASGWFILQSEESNVELGGIGALVFFSILFAGALTAKQR